MATPPTTSTLAPKPPSATANPSNLPSSITLSKPKATASSPAPGSSRPVATNGSSSPKGPPAEAQPNPLYLAANHQPAWQPDSTAGFDEYISDPNKPVPSLGYTNLGKARDYRTEDQRFASQRPDVLIFETEPLKEDLTIAGPIDVYPGDFPPFIDKKPTKMGGCQQLVRGKPFRGKFRRSFETPAPFAPNQPDRIEFLMPDVYHAFRKGHRLLVQVQSSWFPLTDRNPRKLMDIPKALSADFTNATQRVYHSNTNGSKLILRIIPAVM